MRTDRRTLLLSGAALAFTTWSSQACAQAQPGLRPEDFGARGDGRTNDTLALQRCIDAAGVGGTVVLRRGATYRVDPRHDSHSGGIGGLRLRTGQTLQLNGAELRALPTDAGHSSVVQGVQTNGWTILGPGRIIGERDVHRGQGGEWGMGISAWGSDGWTIRDVEVSNCWGDGIYVGGSGERHFCHDFTIERVRVHDCRRNGISIVGGRNGVIRSFDISKIDGTAPRGGIDLEPDIPTRPNRNIRISDGRIYGDVAVGVYIVGSNEGTLVERVQAYANNSGLIVSDRCVGLTIRNCSLRNRNGGQEGAAIRAVGRPPEVRDVQVLDCQLSGGGYFVVDFADPGYPGLQIARNRIIADNPGVQGVARVHGGTFIDNEGIVGERAGPINDFMLHLVRVDYGGNSYRNLSPQRARAIYLGGRELRPERMLSASLTKAAEAI